MIVDDRVIGMTTSGDFGHSVERMLVLGYVPTEYVGRNRIEMWDAAFPQSTRDIVEH